jgi:hypothetical protein
MKVMVRASLLLVLASVACRGQYREIEFRFVPTPCESCTASVPGRMSKVRGVESAELAGTGVLKVKLAPENRARIELLRDMIEQDGTRVKSAIVAVAGTVETEAGGWVMHPVPNGLVLRLQLTPEQEAALRERGKDALGRYLVRGEIREMPARQDPTALTVVSLSPLD